MGATRSVRRLDGVLGRLGWSAVDGVDIHEASVDGRDVPYRPCAAVIRISVMRIPKQKLTAKPTRIPRFVSVPMASDANDKRNAQRPQTKPSTSPVPKLPVFCWAQPAPVPVSICSAYPLGVGVGTTSA